MYPTLSFVLKSSLQLYMMWSQQPKALSSALKTQMNLNIEISATS